MRTVQDPIKSDSDSSDASKTGTAEGLAGWDADFGIDDEHEKSEWRKNYKIVKLANSKIYLIDYLKKKKNISFEVTYSPSGWDHRASCPFKDHQDNSPSFFLNSKGNCFNCYGCGRTGGPVQFIAYYNDKNIIDVAEQILAAYGNLEAEYDEIQDEPENFDSLILDFNVFVKEAIKRNNSNKDFLKFAENVMWSFDVFFEKHYSCRSVIDKDNLCARVELLKKKLEKYERNISSG